MALTLDQIRQQNPNYAGVDDETLFSYLHEKYYSDIPEADLAKAVKYDLPSKPFSESVPEIGKQLVGGAVVDLPRAVGQTAKAASNEGAPLYEWGREVVESADERGKDYQLPEDFERHSLAGKAGMLGSRALTPSLATLPAYAAGPVVGSLATMALFGGSSYQDAYDEVIQAGGTPEQAREAGLKIGAIEGGGEAIANRVGASGLLKLGSKAGKTIGKTIDKATDDALVKPFATSLGKTYGAELSTEIGQSVGSELVKRDYGIGDGDLIDIAGESGLATVGMVTLLAPLGLTAHYRDSRQASAINRILSDPQSATKEERTAVVEKLYQDGKAAGAPDAESWRDGALQDVEQGLTIRRDAPVETPKATIADIGKATTVDEAIDAFEKSAQWESPAANVIPDAEKIVQNRTVPAQPIQQVIDNQFPQANIREDEVSRWVSPNTDEIQAQVNRNKAFSQVETPIDKAKAFDAAEQEAIAERETQLDEIARPLNKSEQKAFRKKRVEIEQTKRDKLENFREGLGYTDIKNQSGQIKNNQLELAFKEAYGRNDNAAQVDEVTATDPSLQSTNEGRATTVSEDHSGVTPAISEEFKPTHVDETGEEYQLIRDDQYADRHGELWTFNDGELNDIQRQTIQSDPGTKQAADIAAANEVRPEEKPDAPAPGHAGAQNDAETVSADRNENAEDSGEVEKLKGEDIGESWVKFADDSKSLNISRADMPQVKAEHRGALVNFLNAKGIKHRAMTVKPTVLKPTQAEFSQEKVEKAKKFSGGNRSILVSSDNHVVDGHHQWLAKLDSGEDIDVIKLGKPIRKLIDDVKAFPSAEQDDGASKVADNTDASLDSKIEKAEKLLLKRIARKGEAVTPAQSKINAKLIEEAEADLQRLKAEKEGEQVTSKNPEVEESQNEAAKPVANEQNQDRILSNRSGVLFVNDNQDIFKVNDPDIFNQLDNVEKLPNIDKRVSTKDKNNKTIYFFERNTEPKWWTVKNGFEARAYNSHRGGVLEVKAPNGVIVRKLKGEKTGTVKTEVEGDLKQLYSGEAFDIFNNFFYKKISSNSFFSKEKIIPVAKITGKEIDVNHPFDSAKAYFKENFQGKLFDSPAGEVRFSGKSWHKVKNGLKSDPLKAQLIPAIPDILSKGVYGGKELLHKERNDAIVAFHFFSGHVSLDGNTVQVGISVGEDAQGNLFYNLNHDTDVLWDKFEGKLTQVMSPGSALESAPDGTKKSIQQADVNIKILTPSKGFNTTKAVEQYLLKGFPNVKKLLDAGTLEVVESINDLPETLQKNGERLFNEDLANVDGLYHDGKIYLVADMLTEANIRPVLQHELLHKVLNENENIRKLVEDARSGLKDIFDKIEQGRYGGQYKAIYNKALKRVEQANTTDADRFEEFLAYSVSVHNEQSMPSRLRDLIRNLITKIKVFLMRYIGIGSLTPADLNSLATQAINSNNPVSGETKLSRGAAINRFTESETAEYLQDTFGKLSSTAKAQSLGLLTLNQIGDVAEKSLPEINKTFVRAVRDMNTEKNKRLSSAGTVADEWSKLPKPVSQEMADLMHDSTVLGVDGSKPYTPAIDIEQAQKQIKILHGKMRSRPGDEKSKMMREVSDLKAQIQFEEKRKVAYPEIRNRYKAFKAKGPKGDFWVAKMDGDKPVIETFKDKAAFDKAKAGAYDYGNSVAARIYHQARDYHENHFRDTLDALIERIGASEASDNVKNDLVAQLRFKFERLQVESPYFPLSRFGEFWVYTEEHGETSFDMFESEAAQQRFIKDMEAQGVEVVGSGKSLENLQEIEGVSVGFISDVDALISELGDLPEVNDLRDSVYQLYLNSLPDASARKHFIHRKKTKGYHRDQLRAFSHKALHDSNNLAKLKYGHKMQRVLDESKEVLEIASSKTKQKRAKELIAWAEEYKKTPKESIRTLLDNAADEDRDKYVQFNQWKEKSTDVDQLAQRQSRLLELAKNIDDKTFAADVLNEVRRAHKDIMAPKMHFVSQWLNSLGFAWYLGVSPAAAAINLTQTPTVALPLLASKVGWKVASGTMGSAMKTFWKGAGKKGQEFRGLSIADQLTGNRKLAYQQWVDSGLIDVTLAHDVAGLSEEGIMTNTFKSKLMHVLSFSFHHAERWNREVTALAAYDAAVKSKAQGGLGFTHQEAVEFAEDIVWRSHFDYANTNRARIMRGNVFRVVTQFKQYSQNITYLYARTFYQAFKGASPEERAEARRALTGLLTMQFSVAGLFGMPVIETLIEAAQIVQDIFGDDDEPEDYKANMRQFLAELAVNFGADEGQSKWIGKLLSKGFIDAVTPYSVADRLSVSELWLRSSDRELEGTDLSWQWAKTILGPMAGVFLENPAIALSMVQEGHYDRAAEKMTPKAIRDALKTVRFATDGVTNMRGDKLKDDYSAFEAIGQMLGFSSSEISEIYEQNNAIKRLEAKMKKRRDQLLSRAANARIDQDSAAFRDAMKEIRAFNQKNPKQAILMKNINLSIQARLRRSADTENALYLSKRNRDLRDQFTFAN